jgi:hypothetical protein
MERSENGLRRALELLKEFRLAVMAEGIDPRDTHVAMGVAYVLDELEAGDHTDPQEHLELHAEGWRQIRKVLADQQQP